MSIPVLYANGVALPTAETSVSFAFGETVTISGTPASGWSIADVRLVNRPDESTASTSSASALPATFTIDKGGRYRVRVILTGPGGAQVVAFGVLVGTTGGRDLTLLDESDNVSEQTRDRLNAGLLALDSAVVSPSQTQHVATLSALRAVVPEANAAAIVRDVGTFVYDADDTTTADDDGITCVVGTGGYRWVRVRPPIVTAGVAGAGSWCTTVDHVAASGAAETAYSFAPEPDGMTTVSASANGVDGDGTDGWEGSAKARFLVAGGVVTQVGSTTAIDGEGTAGSTGCALAIDTSGGLIRVRVTSPAAGWLWAVETGAIVRTTEQL